MTEGQAPGTLYLFGAGGHGRELAWLAREVFPDATIAFVVDDDERYSREPVNGFPVHAVGELASLPAGGFVAAVGDSALRRTAVSALVAAGLEPVSLVHPRAELSPNVRIAPGAVVCAGTVLTDNVEIGAHSHINIGCTLSHDVRLGEFVTLSPGVHLAGNVVVEDGAFIGVGANVINGSPGSPLVIGAGSVVAAGAAVTRSVDPDAIVGGVPARALRTGTQS